MSEDNNHHNEIIERLQKLEDRDNREHKNIAGALRPLWDTYRDLSQLTKFPMADLMREHLKAGLLELNRLRPIFEEIDRCRLFVRQFGEDSWEARWFDSNPFRLKGQYDEIHNISFWVDKRDAASCNAIGTTLGLDEKGENIITQVCFMLRLFCNPMVKNGEQDYFRNKIGTVFEMIVARCADSKTRESRALDGVKPTARLGKGAPKKEIDYKTILRLAGFMDE